MPRIARFAAALVLISGCSAAVTLSPMDGGDAGMDPPTSDAGNEATSPADGAGPTDAAVTDAGSDGLVDTGVVIDTDCGVEPAIGPAVDFSQPAIFWTECNVLRAANLNGTGKVTIATGMFPTGVAVDGVAGKVYWTDNGADTISRANLDGGAAEVLYTSPDRYSNPNGIAVDHAANRIFWTEFPSPPGSDGGLGYGVVKTAALDGSNPIILYAGAFPTGVTTQPPSTDLYFTDNGTDTVTKGNYDGGSAVVLHTDPDPYSNPSSVVADSTGGFIFWARAGGVYRMLTDGGATTKIADAGYSDGLAIDPIVQQVYFTDNMTDTITRIAYDGSSPTLVHQAHNPFSNPRGVAVRR